MALINLDLIGAYAINQGFEWRVKIRYPANALGSSIRGKVAEDWDHIGFTAFQLGIPTYNKEEDYTEFPLYLSPRQTLDIPLSGDSHWVYGVALSRGGQPDVLLMSGKVHCLPSLNL